LDAEKKRKCVAVFAVVAAISFPIITGNVLTLYAKFFPHELRYMQGKYIISISFILAIPIVYLVSQKFVKSSVLKFLIRLPVVVIFVVLAFLFTIRSYCDPYWFEEDEEESTTSIGSTNSEACK